MEKTWVIVDSKTSAYLETLDIRDKCVTEEGAVAHYRISKRRLRGGVQDGIDVVEVDTGALNIEVLVTRGMNIAKARCGDVELKWDSPVEGPVHPKHVPLFAPNGCGWLEGFSEWIARCGLESNGAPEFDSNGVLKYPLHGRLSNLPARRVTLSIDSDSGLIRLSGDILETSVFGRKFLFRVTYTLQAGSSKLIVDDSVTNLLTTDDEFELLYHINTGYPLVSPGAQFVAPFHSMCPRDQNAVKELPNWNRFEEPQSGRPETCYFFDLVADAAGDTRVGLINAACNRGVTLSFNKNDFPYFILWKTQRPNGDIYVSGMEPAVNFPNTRSFEKEHGRLVPLAAGRTKSFRFILDVLKDKSSVDEFVTTIERLQSTSERKIVESPIPEYCE